MTPSELLIQAKQGDVKAIAALLNQVLQPKGISAKASLKDGCLQVMLESAEVPDPIIFAEYVHRGMKNLKLASVHTLRVYGRQLGQQTPAWNQIFQLGQRTPHSLGKKLTGTATNPASDTPLPQSLSALKELAREGNQAALTTLLNRAIAAKGYTVKVDLLENGLHLWVEAPRTPDPDDAVTLLVHRELSHLRAQFIQTVIIKGRRQGQVPPMWAQEFVAQPLVDDRPFMSYVRPEQRAMDTAAIAAQSSTQIIHPISQRITPTPSDAELEPNVHLRRWLGILCHSINYWVFLLYGLTDLPWLVVLMPLVIPLALIVLCDDDVVQDNAKEVWNFQFNLLILLLALILFLVLGFVFSIELNLLMIAIVVFNTTALVLPIFALLQVVTTPHQSARYPFVVRIIR